MRLAVGSDERTPLTDLIVEDLRARGHEVLLFGSLWEVPMSWAEVGRAVGLAVAARDCDQGVLLCWTSTGVSIAANKVAGVRVALCTDAATAEGARRWNDANVLCLSLRLTSEAIAKEMFDAWFAATVDESERASIDRLDAYRSR